MKHFRIITDGSKFRVQKRLLFAGFRMWHNERYYEVNDTYPKVLSHNVEFDTEDEAKHYIQDQMTKLDLNGEWREIAKF